MVLLLWFLSPMAMEAGFGCDVIVVQGKATVDGSVILCALWEWHDQHPYPILHVDRQSHNAGEMLQLTFRMIPQAPETWSYNYSHPTYGGDKERRGVPLVAHGINEWGVAIGSTTLQGKLPGSPTGVDLDDLNRVALERAPTAHEAVRLIGELIETYSYAQGKYDCGQLWFIADCNAAWVLECGGGRHWAARRIREEIFSAGNGSTITNDFDLSSNNLIDFAKQKGWCTGREDFCWADRFAKRIHQERSKVIRDYIQKPKLYGRITPETFKTMLGSSGIGLYRGMATSQTTFIAHLRGDVPEVLRAKGWFSSRPPGYNNLFFPLYAVDGVRIGEALGPTWESYIAGKGSCRYWEATHNHLLQTQAETYSNWVLARSSQLETEVLSCLAGGQSSKAQSLLEAFHDETISKAMGVYTQDDIVLMGQVLTLEGKPVPGATVWLGNSYITPETACKRRWSDDSPPGPQPTWKDGLYMPASLRSGSDGRFSFNLLLAGETDIWAEHPEYGWGWIQAVRTHTQDVRIILKPQAETLSFSGVVLDPANEPVAGAALYVYEKNLYSEKSLLAETQSNRQGRFEFSAVQPKPRFRELLIMCIPKRGVVGWKTVPCCSGTDIQIQLKREGRLRGCVVNSEGEGFSDAKIRLHKAVDPTYGWAFFQEEVAGVLPTAITNASGHFTLGGIPGGSTVELIAQYPGQGYAYSARIAALPESQEIPRIQFQEGITIEGTVRYADGNQGAEGIGVKAGILGCWYGEAVTRVGGRYRIVGLQETLDDMYIVQAEVDGEALAWAGKAVIDKELKRGDRLVGVDILLRRTLASRQQEWQKKQGKPQTGNTWIAVLTDCDPVYSGKTKYKDRVVIYDSSGARRGHFTGLNISQTVGANHALAFNPIEGALWCKGREKRLLTLRTDGTVQLETAAVHPQAMAVDAKTGNVWALTRGGTIYGKGLTVLNSSGAIQHNWKHGGFDIAYSTHEDCFWILGKKLLKLSKEGKIVQESRRKFAWVAVSIDVNDLDGSVWVVERWHCQVAGSRDCVLIFAPDGSCRKEIDLDYRGTSCVAVDAIRGFAWVAMSDGILKMNSDGTIVTDIPLRGFSVCVESDTGYVWVTNRDGLYRLDQDGRIVWSDKNLGNSQKWVCALEQRVGT